MNVILEPKEYTTTREWLRKTDILWRDMSSAMRVPSWGEVICDKDHCIGQKSCAQIAYELLRKHYPNLKLQWRKSEFELLDHRPPKVFNYPVYGRLWYIDIKSAYKQFYQYLYLHSDFPYKRQKYPLYDLAQEFNDKPAPEWKIARNCVVGITRSTTNKWVQSGKTWKTRKRNNYLSPTLWAQLQGLLNQIAEQMLDYGAVWVNTDGYAFLSEDSYNKAINFLDEKGVIIGDKGNGLGYINGLHSIHIPGVKETRCNDNSTTVYHLETSNIDHLNYWMSNRKAIEQ